MRNIICRIGIVLALCAMNLSMAWAHDGEVHTLSDLAYTWSFDPLIIFLLAVSGIGYVVGVSRLWLSAGIGRGVSRWSATAFASAWISMIVALISPLHPMGEVL